jgi:hypothetical protein
LPAKKKVVSDIGGQNGNHSQDDLAKFGCRLDGNSFIFWLPAGSSFFFFFFFFFWVWRFHTTVTK